MKIVITGVSGFVGGYLVNHILEQDPTTEIYGLDIVVAPPNSSLASVSYYQLDMFDDRALESVLKSINPDYIIHLASFSSVSASWDNPVSSFKNNTNIFLNLVESVRSNTIRCRILSVGSSEQYGVVRIADLPLDETIHPNPTSPYAVARVAQENLSLIYARAFNMDIVCTRSFNHIGPGQTGNFLVSSLGKQFAQIRMNERKTIHVGTLSVIRDFLDVRDVVRAYWMLLQQGKSGEVYNICSGQGKSVRDIIELYAEVTSLQHNVEINRDLQRPIENQAIVGSNKKIVENIGWKPEIDIRNSLRDIFEYWLNKPAQGSVLLS